MYYVGKFLTNVKGLYNEINPATLTGAIDVIVVRQKDGTYATSPWHVRFGKMSVISTREKVVDIEINGEPADLHMKLGEAGEAFFVQETDDTYEVPAYLATSPISPGFIEMEAGLVALKAACANSSCSQEEPLTPVIEHCGTVITLEDGKVVVSGIPPPMLLADDRQYFSDSDATTGSALLSRRRRQRESVSTQTNLLSRDIEYINVDCGRPSTPPGEWYSGLLTDVQATKSCVDHQQAVACSLPTVCNSLPATQALTTKLRSQPLYISNQAGKVTTGKPSRGGVVSPEDCQFEMDLSDDEQAVSPIFRIRDSADLGIVSRCISMPSIHQSDGYDIVDKWATKQYATTAMCVYADVTPTTSPVNSRPVSPLSDSEIINLNRDATSQTLLTGSRLAMVDDVKWQWGEFPESSSAHRLSILAAAAASEVLPVMRKVEEDGAVGDVITQIEKDSVVESLMSELTSSVFSTGVCENLTSESLTKPSSSPSELVDVCHATPAPEAKKASSKKSCSVTREQGIYLEDLTLDEPELAALYLYNPKSNSPPRLPISKDEDSESGRGASLPQSPVTVEVECRDTSDTSYPKKLSCSLTEVALSLCGPLDHADTVISEERFNQFLVTYDVLMENPNFLSDPNLIVKVDGRFYNWAVAAPIIMSSVVFKKPLTETCMSRLISQHLPKKEPSSGGVWQRLWGRGKGKTGGAGASAHVAASSPPTNGTESASASSSHQASPPNTPQKCKGDNKSSTSNVESVVTSEEEGDVLVMPVATGEIKASRNEIKASRNESSYGHAPTREKCRKSLKLTSDEIARLNLKDGVNEVTFSVTTQYQGTTRCQCYVYLWQWDDRIVVSDIDGTITKSDVLGQVLPMIGSVLPYISTDWSQAGIAQLYQMISRNNYKFLYLSARAIGQSKLTRDYLRGVRQSDIHLPDGPLLLSPSSLISAFHKEVIERKPEQFKISCLRDISALFPPTENPFIAGFGNKINDVWAYREVGIPLSRIFTVNHKGELRMDSTQAFQSSYKRLSDIVDHLFPPRPSHVIDSLTVSSDFNSFSYWRSQVPLLDTTVVNDFIKNRDAAAAADKSSNAKKAAVKKPVSATVSAPAAGNMKSIRKADSKSVAK